MMILFLKSECFLQNVVTSFEELGDYVGYPAKAQKVGDYFEDTWIRRPIQGNTDDDQSLPM